MSRKTQQNVIFIMADALANLPIPNYLQEGSFGPLLEEDKPEKWSEIAYHRYLMHLNPNHNAFSHYGIRNKNYKLIYWYNEGYDLP